MCLWVLSEVVCARLLGSDKCLKHCMSKKLQLRLLSFSCQLPFPFLPSYHRSCTDCWYMNTSLSKGKYFLCLRSEGWRDLVWLSWFMHFAAALHSNTRHQGERVHTCYQSPKLWGLEDCRLLNVSLAIYKDSWQRDFNIIQCHTLEEKLNFAKNTTTAKCSYLIQLISKIFTEIA